jgi:hypothetical protein
MKKPALAFLIGSVSFAASLSAATLVSRYDFNNSLNDAVGGHHASVGGGTITYDSGAPALGAQSALFASSYATVPDKADQSFTSSFSISAWIYLTGESADVNTIVAKWGGGTPYRAYSMEYGSSTHPTASMRRKLRFTISQTGNSGSDISQVVSDTKLILETWYHVAAVYSTNGTTATMKLYINGQLDSTLTGAKVSVKDSSSPLSIGSNGNHGTNVRMKGRIDDLRLYSGALTNEEVTALSLTPTTATLVSRYDFEGNLQDSKGGYTASVGGGTVNFETATTPSGAQSGVFNSSYATVPDNAAQSFTDSFSITSWIYLTGEPTHQNHIVAKWGAGFPYRAYCLGYMTSTHPTPANRKRLQFNVSRDGDSGTSVSQVTSKSTLSLNTWYHVAAVYKKSGTTAGMELYINGQLDATLNGAVTSVHDSASPLSIGSFTDHESNVRMKGKIDDLRLYSGALTYQEVANIRASGALQLPWSPELLGDLVWLEWRAEDLPDGPVAVWTDRKVALSGTQPITNRQPVKQNGEVFFEGGSASNYNQGKGLIFNRLYDGPWLPEVTHRAIAIVFRIDLSGTQSGGTLFTVNGQSGAQAARQPAVSYNAATDKISIGFNSPNSQANKVVAPYIQDNLITFPVTTTASQWHCLVARRVGTNLHASLDGKDINGAEGETVIPMADWALPRNNQGPILEGENPDPDGDNGLIGDHAKTRSPFAIDSIFLVQGDMSTETAQKFMGWGMWKKGAQAQLPTTHPYRNAPPVASLPRAPFVESTPQQWTNTVNFWADASQSETPYERTPINLTGWTEVFRDDFTQPSVTDDVQGQGTWFAPGHAAAVGPGVIAVRPSVNAANRALGGAGTPATYIHNATDGTMTLRMQLHQTGTTPESIKWHSGAFASVNSNGYGRTWMYPYAEVRMKIGRSTTGTTKGI